MSEQREVPTVTGEERVYLWDGPPRLELLQETVTLPGGHSYLTHRLVPQGGRTGVVVVAERQAEVLFVCSYRTTIGRSVIELPRGFGETDPDDPDGAIIDALRELREETGHSGHGARVLGRYVTDTGLLPAEVAVVGCRIEPGARPGDTDGEAEGNVWFRRAELADRVASGELADGHTLAALAVSGMLR